MTDIITNPRLVERIAWLVLFVALVAVPFVGLALDAPLTWYAGAVVWLAVLSTRAR